MSERDDWNRNVIEEFRTNDGVVGGMFEGASRCCSCTTKVRSRAPSG